METNTLNQNNLLLLLKQQDEKYYKTEVDLSKCSQYTLSFISNEVGEIIILLENDITYILSEEEFDLDKILLFEKQIIEQYLKDINQYFLILNEKIAHIDLYLQDFAKASFIKQNPIPYLFDDISTSNNLNVKLSSYYKQ